MKEKKCTKKRPETSKLKVAATESQVKSANEKIMKKYNKAIKALAFR